MTNYKTSTVCVQGGYEPKNGEPRVVPIVQSTTFKYESSEQMGNLFDLKESGYFYTRLSNPTNDAVANKICQLEGGVAAILTSSGQAANFYAMMNIASAGDHIISSSAIYGGTYNLIAHTMKQMGIESTFVEPDISPEELEKKFQPNTKLVFGETLSNPSLSVLDIEKFANAAHKHGVPLIVDNTFPTPIFCKPFEWGVDIVTHSTTKYMNGTANSVGGAVVDSGNFDWTKHSDRFPGLTTPDETYHGTVYTESFGKAAYIVKMTTNLMRDLGSIPSPQNAFYLGIGLETLHLRMERHFQNALALAKHLENHPKVSWVSFSGLENDSQHELAEKYLPNGSCGVIAFGVKGGREAAIKFMDSLKLAAIVTHVADSRTCVLHPASTTHRQMNDEELAAAGISQDLVRMSVGIEDIDDIIADVDLAKMCDALFLRRLLRELLLLPAEDILLSNDDETRLGQLETVRERADLDVQIGAVQRLSILHHGGRDAGLREKLAQGGSLLRIADEEKGVLPVGKPAARLVLQQIHLPLEGGDCLHGKAHETVRLRTVNLLQHESREKGRIPLGVSHELLPREESRLEFGRLLDELLHAFPRAQRLVENDGALARQIGEDSGAPVLDGRDGQHDC